MGKPTTNTDGKNAQHKAKVLQSKGFSKQGSQEIIEGKAPKDPVDKARGKDQIQAGTEAKVREMANETYVNRVKTSDKQQKAVMDFIKG